MKKIITLIKESIWDLMKDYIKLIILSAIGLFIALITNFIKEINSIELTIKLPVIILCLMIFLISVSTIIVTLKSYNRLKKEYEESLTPYNENINKFRPGDTVISRLEKNSMNPSLLVVTKILKSEVTCRNKDGQLINYVPEELLTKGETEFTLFSLQVERESRAKQMQEISDFFYR